jgi:hypothetical protein
MPSTMPPASRSSPRKQARLAKGVHQVKKIAALLGAVVAVLMVAAVTMAAGPSPSASPAAGQSSASGQSQSGTTSTSTATASTTANYSAQVQPGLLTGNVQIETKADGAGVVTMQVNGLIAKLDLKPTWIVKIDGNGIPSTHIAYLSDPDVTWNAPDTIQFHLTKDQMSNFEQALKSSGVIIDVSNGYRLDAAVIPAQ